MSFLLKEQVGVCAIAILNGWLVYPQIKHYYRQFYSLKLPIQDPTHFVYMDFELDGRDIGRLDFELFGTSSPKSVNNFLGFITGDFNQYMRYKNSYILKIYEQRFLQAGDFMNQDGTGSMTVYGTDKMEAEQNNLSFDEPYLLAMSADAEGRTGCQFFITMQQMPCLNNTKHTIIGRLIKGKDTLNIVEGISEFRKQMGQQQNVHTKVLIKDCGVYKFSKSNRQLQRQSAVNESDFKPNDFLNDRANR